jgi:hypothetical protein
MTLGIFFFCHPRSEKKKRDSRFRGNDGGGLVKSHPTPGFDKLSPAQDERNFLQHLTSANSATATARNNVALQHNNLIWAVPDLTGILGDDPCVRSKP